MTTRRWVAVAAVLTLAGGIALSPTIKPYYGSSALAGASEVRAYRLEPGAAITLPIPAGQHLLRILFNLDLPPTATAEGQPFTLRVRIPEDHIEREYPMVAVPAQRAPEGPAMFYLGAAVIPALTREVLLERGSSAAATLELSMSGPGAGTLRVLGVRDVVHLAKTVTDDGSSAEPDTSASARLWARLPAAPGTPVRRMYFRGKPIPQQRPPPVTLPRPDELWRGYTVKGPGVLRLRSPKPCAGHAHLTLATGIEQELPIQLAADRTSDIPVPAGLMSIVVEQPIPEVQAEAAQESLALQPDDLEPLPSGEFHLNPSVIHAQAARPLPPGSAVLRYGLRLRGARELRLSVRAEGTRPVTLRWVIRAARGQVEAEGELVVPAVTEPGAFTELGGALSMETVRILWPTAEAEALELNADGACWTTVASPAFEPDPLRDVQAPTRIRHGPLGSPAWMSILPEDVSRLRREGRWARETLPIVLEPKPPSAEIDAESLVPAGDPLRLPLLEPSGDRDSGTYWSVRSGLAQRLAVVAKNQASASRAPLSITYLGPAGAGASAMTFAIDGAQPTRSILHTSSGRIALPPVRLGAHVLRVDGPPDTQLFADQRVEGGVRYRWLDLFELSAGAPMTLQTGASPAIVGAIVYFEGPPPSDARLEATLLTVPAKRPAVSTVRTDRVHVWKLTAQPTGAICLTRPCQRIHEAAPVALRLGDDLPARPQRLRIRLTGAPRAYVRFFTHPWSPLPGDETL